MMVRDQRLNRTGLLALLLATLVVSGCGGEGPYPVDGKIVFKDGKPATELAGYTIDFELESEKKKFSASGFVNADASFTVGTHKPGDGAIPGTHRVALSPPVPDDERPRPPPAIPERYRSFQTSGLKAEIKAGRNQILLEVERTKR